MAQSSDVRAADDRLEVVDPSTGASLGAVRVDTENDVLAAVGRAHDTAGHWGAMPPSERAHHLRQVRRAFADAVGDLAAVVSAETGKSLFDATFETAATPPMWNYVIRAAPKALRPESIATRPIFLKRAWVERDPYGVVGVIGPWNYPVGIPMQILPWVLACGNTAVLKPSELTPRTGQLIGEIVASAGLPLVEVVTGAGPTGSALVNAGVDKIAFTGSGATARRILAATAQTLTPVVMELGGKDAMIVCDDADLERAAKTAVGGAFFNAGQTCMAIERVYATPRVWDQLVEKILRTTDSLRVGNDDQSHVGPITDPRQMSILESRLAEAVAGGAKVLRGGQRSTHPDGTWFEPTVITDVPTSCALATEETFGPVLALYRVSTEDEAVARANDCALGLSASVFSRSHHHARSVASRLETGGVVINDALIGAGLAGLPFGGEKQSGFGRLQGRAGFDEFSRRRSVVADRFPRSPSLIAAVTVGRRPRAQSVQRLVRALWGTRRR